MKIFNYILSLSLLLLFLLSCQKENVQMNEILTIKATIEAKSKSRLNSFPFGSQIGIQCNSYNGVSWSKHETYATFNSSTLSWTLQNQVLLNNNSSQVKAYYPYQNGLIEEIPINIEDNIDYMYSNTAIVNNLNTTADLVFQHVLSCVRVTITKGSYQGAGVLSSVNFTSSAIAKAGRFTLDGVVHVDQMGGSIARNVTGTISSTPIVNEFFIIPCDTEGEVEIELVIDGKEMFKTIEIPERGFQQGVLYDYNIIIDQPTKYIHPNNVGPMSVLCYTDNGRFVFLAGNNYNSIPGLTPVGWVVDRQEEVLTIAAMQSIGYLHYSLSGNNLLSGCLGAADGRTNTDAVLQAVNNGSFSDAPAAQGCNNYSIAGVPGFGVGQWYMPAQDELSQLGRYLNSLDGSSLINSTGNYFSSTQTHVSGGKLYIMVLYRHNGRVGAVSAVNDGTINVLPFAKFNLNQI